MSRAGRYTVLIFLLSVIQAQSLTEDPVHLLLKLVSKTDNKPMVVYMDTEKAEKKRQRFVDFLIDDGKESVKDRQGERDDFEDLLSNGDAGLLEDDDDVETLEDNARNQAKSLLYNFLRTSPDDLDPKLEDSKQVLRQALRARCGKVTSCVKKCTIEKPSCPNKCQKIFDESNLCEPPKPPKRKKCGKTMPPKWRL